MSEIVIPQPNETVATPIMDSDGGSRTKLLVGDTRQEKIIHIHLDRIVAEKTKGMYFGGLMSE